MASVRVLHVVGQMNLGGIETWLVQVLRRADRARVRMDFLVSTAQPGHYDEELRRLGAAVIPCESPSNPPRYARRFLEVLRGRGPYDVVHSHVHHFSGFVLSLARHARVPVRIAHAHSDTRSADAGVDAPRRLYLAAMRTALRLSATRGFAVSAEAAAALFGPRWRADPRWRVARCGIDLEPFRARVDAAAVRAELGVPPDAVVLGHAGRLDPLKNHALLLRMVRDAARLDGRAFLLLVGDGPIRGRLEADAASLGVRDRVVFAGARGDVPRVLRAMDVFVMPSLREGLPLAVLEAQAAGLPVVLSDRITDEVEVIPELFTRRSLSAPASAWAEAALAAAAARRLRDSEAIARLERSDFSLARSLESLLEAYGATPPPVERSA